MYKKINILITILISFSIFSCGEGIVEVTNESYEPKIAIEGFLIANQKVDKVRISRNFRIDDNLNRTTLIPNVNQTIVSITDIAADSTFYLTFHVSTDDIFDEYYWQYNYDSLKIDYGKSYRLDVSTVIDGKQLSASATTTVPQQGLNISGLNYNQLTFRQKDQSGNLQQFQLTFDRAPGTTFYAASIRSMNADSTNFIYEHPFYNDEDDLIINDFNFQYGWIQDTPPIAGQSKLDIFWTSLWFYDTYELIIYAADKNYKEFIQTYNDVQEQDGNFHEPKFNIEGDGIGVFGSMVADTAYIEVLKN